MERKSEHIDKEQLEPPSHISYARNINKKDKYDKKTGYDNCSSYSFKRYCMILLIIENQHNGRDAEQIKQMHSNWQPDNISYQDNPTVTIYRIRFILPAKNHPEDQCRKKRRESINFTFYRTEPKCITECICQGSDKSRPQNDDNIHRW